MIVFPYRGYLAVTEEGVARLREGGLEGAYVGPDGRVHIPGKRVTHYSDPSPPKEVSLVCHSGLYSALHLHYELHVDVRVH